MVDFTCRGLLLLLVGWLLAVVALPVAAGPAPTRAGYFASVRPSPPPSAGAARRQQRQVDSLTALLQRASPADTAYINRLNSLALLLRTNEPARSADLFRRALRLAQRLQYALGQANAWFGLGYYYRAQNQYPLALAHTLRAQRLYQQLRDTSNQARVYYNLARIYAEQGIYGRSLEASRRGLRLAEIAGSQRAVLFHLIQMGITATELGERDAAAHYLHRAVAVAVRLPDAIGEGHAYLALGDLAASHRQWLAAQRYYERALRSYQPAYNELGLLPTRIKTVAMIARQGNPAVAEATARPLLRYARQVGARTDVAQLLLSRAEAGLRRQQPDSAAVWAEQSLRISRANGLRRLSAEAADLLARSHAARGQFAQAYRYQTMQEAYADTLTGENVRQRIEAQRLGYERRQQQSRLRQLYQQRELERVRQQRQLALLVSLGLLLLLGVGGWFWVYRQREQRREMALRNRLAADLHDDVGTLLSQIAMQSSLLQEDLTDAAGQREQLGQIAEASRAAVRQLNDVVWSLDAHNDQLPDLLDRMRDYAYEVLGSAGLEVQFELPAQLPTRALPVLVRRNLYLIYKEALHNALRHAVGATLVKVRVQYGPAGRLSLLIHDNGQGAEAGAAAPGRRSGHGLRNMAERARVLGGTVRSGPEASGFAVYVELPLPPGGKRA